MDDVMTDALPLNGAMAPAHGEPVRVDEEIALMFHPLANCFPLLEGQPFDELVADIQRQGVLEPVWVYMGQILDGRNRYRASLIAGVPCPMREMISSGLSSA